MAETDSGPEPEPYELDESHDDTGRILPDHFLVTLVEIANKVDGFGFGIRLFVGGVVLSGTLVGGEEFFAGVARDLGEGLEESLNPMGQLFGNMGSLYKDRRMAISGDDDLPVEYVHLKDAWSYAPGQSPLLVGRWRGRLSRVDGWATGVYGSEDR